MIVCYLSFSEAQWEGLIFYFLIFPRHNGNAGTMNKPWFPNGASRIEEGQPKKEQQCNALAHCEL